jgi:dTDP-4-amino-4,6-dideoxygalactose transaminase
MIAKKIPFFQHELGHEELNEIRKVFDGTILTTGDTVREFERLFSNYLNCRHTLGVNSCTGALHLSLVALGIGPGDEVITTPLTFVATATAIIESGATPVFIDVESDTGNIDVTRIESAITHRTKAIMPVHLYGLMCDMVMIKKIADQYDLAIIEDCAHCIEGERDGIKPGQLSDTACFSFFATKNITCGEGGAVICNDDALYDRLKVLSLHGMNKTSIDRHKEGYSHWDVKELGWKYNLSNIQAAILIPQIKNIARQCDRRHALSEYYKKILSKINEIKYPGNRINTTHAHHLFTVWIDEKKRDKVIQEMIKADIGVVVNYRAIHLLTFFSKSFGYKKGDFYNAENIGNRTISLPFYPSMSKEYAKHVVDTLQVIIDE